jgi:hypothetical protein
LRLENNVINTDDIVFLGESQFINNLVDVSNWNPNTVFRIDATNSTFSSISNSLKISDINITDEQRSSLIPKVSDPRTILRNNYIYVNKLITNPIAQSINLSKNDEILYIPSGTYTETPININKNITISGRNNDIKYNELRSSETIIQNCVFYINSNITIKGIKFVATPISVSNKSNFILKNSIIEDVSTHALNISGINSLEISRNKISEVGDQTGLSNLSGIKIENSSNISITDNLIEKVDFHGITLSNNNNVTIQDNYIKNVGKLAIENNNNTNIINTENIFENVNIVMYGWGQILNSIQLPYAPRTIDVTTLGNSSSLEEIISSGNMTILELIQDAGITEEALKELGINELPIGSQNGIEYFLTSSTFTASNLINDLIITSSEGTYSFKNNTGQNIKILQSSTGIIIKLNLII